MVDLPPLDPDLAVGLVLSEASLRPGDPLLYSVINHGCVAIMTGSRYVLDLREGDGWNELALGLNFRSVGLVIYPGQRRDMRAIIGLDAVPGTYRLRKQIELVPPPSAELGDLPHAARLLPIELAIAFRLVNP